MTNEENNELIKEMLGFITMKCNVMNIGNYEILASMIKDDVDRIISKLHQPTVISSVCCCGILDSERQNVERNLNECIICNRTIKQTDL